MDNANTQPSATPEATNTTSSTPTSSTPTSSTPTGSTPTSSTTVTPEPKQDKKKTVMAIVGVVAIIAALIVINVISKSISKHNAEKHLDETIEVCEDKGYYSDECEDLRDKYGVTCNMFTGECEIEYKYTLFF